MFAKLIRHVICVWSVVEMSHQQHQLRRRRGNQSLWINKQKSSFMDNSYWDTLYGRVERQKINPRVGQAKNAMALSLIVKPFVILCDTGSWRVAEGPGLERNEFEESWNHFEVWFIKFLCNFFVLLETTANSDCCWEIGLKIQELLWRLRWPNSVRVRKWKSP